MSPLTTTPNSSPVSSPVRGPVRGDAPGNKPNTGVGVDDVALFRHAKRRHWGVAALLWERDDKRGYQFSDGNLRVFRKGFYHLFEKTAAPGDGSAKAVRRLARLARADDVTAAGRLPTLRDQILLFRRSFPEGFAGAAWQRRQRGVGVKKQLKRLKRHRDAAISEAHQLSADELAGLIERSEWDEVHARLRRVLASTDLVTASALAKLDHVAPCRDLSVALRDWVAQDELADPSGQDRTEVGRRFNHLVRLLGPAGSWPLVSAIAGLQDPEHHTCIRPTVFDLQAKMLLPNFSAEKHPRYVGYQRYLHVAHTVFDELENAGLGPQDLLDVYDFMWATLRPAAREELTQQYELAPLPSSQAATDELGSDEQAA